MSGHHHERKEKVCLNCGAQLYGHYCHVCGQENNEPKESVGHLLRHFFEDVTHFDGKFFASMKYLFTRPGFMATEYMKGKRASYLNPIRLYLLSSAIFLILMAKLVNGGSTDPKITEERERVEASNKATSFSWEFASVPGINQNVTMLHFDHRLSENGVHVYDSIQNSLPKDSRDEGIDRYIGRRLAAAATVYHEEPNRFMSELEERFVHSFSTVFFISLPLFALFLQLLYIRRKQYYFVAHSVFSIHFFCVVFISMLLSMSFIRIIFATRSDMVADIFSYALLFMPLLTYLYLFVAMKRFYNQGWFKTFIKSLFQVTFFGIIFLVLTIVFYFNSMFKIIEESYQLMN